MKDSEKDSKSPERITEQARLVLKGTKGKELPVKQTHTNIRSSSEKSVSKVRN